MLDNRENIKNLPLVWNTLMRQFALDQECVLPAVVLSYDRENNLVTCRPAINRITASGESVQRTEHIVPCLNPCGNNIGINFPLVPGDTGWLVAADRNTANFQQSKDVADPQTGELHRYAFGVFIPDIIHDLKIDTDDDGALVIETADARTRISIKENRVKITRDSASSETNGFCIQLDTPTSQIMVADDGTVTISATQTTINGLCGVSTGATGVISLASIATVEKGIVTAIL